MNEAKRNELAAPSGSLAAWRKVGKEWHDRYHPNIYRLRDGAKHSQKKPR